MNKMTVTIDNILKSIEDTVPLAEMAEFAFKEHFLPYFTGDKKDTDDFTRSKWIEFADGADKEVKIIDPEGKELYRVPPITGGIDIEKTTEHQSYSQINTDGVKEIERFPIKGVREYGEALESTVGSLVVTGHLDRWKDILSRYKEEVSSDIDPTIYVEDDEDIVYE